MALFVLIGAVLGIAAIIVATSLTAKQKDGEVTFTEAQTERLKVANIFEGELPMSSEVSEYWGKLALEEANKARR